MVTSTFSYEKLILLILLAIFSIFMPGCAKKEKCAYCGEEKYCNEYNILGTTRFICDKCLNDPTSSISGNVLLDYESDLIDPELYIVSVNDVTPAAVSDNGFIPIGDNTQTDTASVTPSEDIIPETAVPTPAPTDVTPATPEPTPTPSETAPSSNVNINTKGKDTVVANIQTALSAQGYYLKQSDDTDTKYELYNGNTATGIMFDFSGSDSQTTKLTASMPKGASDVDFLNTCICSALGFMGSDDYYGVGADVYNNAVLHGNYSYNGCKFYYTEASDKEVADGGPIVRFQASYQ
jgi:hypothetical protein